MTPHEVLEVCDKIGKLWPTVTDEMLLVLQPQLAKLPIDTAQAMAALDDEFLRPTTAKVNRIAALWQRLSAIASTNRQERSAPTGPRTVAVVAGEVLALLARAAERQGREYARGMAWKLWTLWRRELIDAGMREADANLWLAENTPVEDAWVDDLERRLVAGRAKQTARMRKLAERWEREAQEAAA
jgi:hypothetical protein